MRKLRLDSAELLKGPDLLVIRNPESKAGSLYIDVQLIYATEFRCHFSLPLSDITGLAVIARIRTQYSVA
jgi:hypothetical protein